MANKQTTLTRIDFVCEKFEDQWQSESEPELTNFLEGFVGSARKNLFFHLLEIDIDYRRQRGTLGDIEARQQQFPEYEEVIREVYAAAESESAGNEPPAQHDFANDSSVNQRNDVTWNEAKSNDSRGEIFRQVSAPAPTLGGYELLEVVGRGGMGIVYRARQKSLGRIVALKMVRPEQVEDSEFLTRFQAEAKAAASLAHPGIVQVYDVGEDQGHHFFAMEMIEGQSLSELVAADPLPDHKAAELTKQIAQAMSYAHDNGLIHRDLKPANILIDAAGQAKVTDFGLAKTMQADSNLTATGHVLGTPSYMPPEQAIGDLSSIAQHSDIYSIGAILYQLLTGRPPFQSPSPYETIFQVMHNDAVGPRQLNPLIAKDLETICLKCLEKEPRRRYQSAQLLADDLHRFLSDRPILARPAGWIELGWRWSRRNRVVSMLLALFVASVMIGLAVSIYYALLAESRVAAAVRNESIARKQTAQTIETIERTVAHLSADQQPLEQRRRAVIGDLLDSLNEIYRGFQMENRIDLNRAKTQLLLGQLSLDLGDEGGEDSTGRTQAYFERAVDLMRAVHNDMPADEINEDTIFFYANSLSSLAMLYFENEEVSRARKLADQAHEIYRQQFERISDDVYVRMAYANSCKMNALIQMKDNSIDEAEKSLLQSIEIAEPALQVDDAQQRVKAKEVLANLHETLAMLGIDDHRPGVLEHLKEAEVLHTQLIEEFPDTINYRWQLSYAFELYADYYFENRDFAEAKIYYDRSYRLSQECVEKRPENFFWQWQLAYCLDDQAKVAAALGQVDQEIDFRIQAVQIRIQFAPQDQSNRELLGDLFEDLRILLPRLVQQGDLTRAQELVDQTLAAFETMKPETLATYQGELENLQTLLR